MSEVLNLIYIGQKIRKDPPKIDKRFNNVIQSHGSGRSYQVLSMSHTVENGKVMYIGVDAMYAQKLCKVSPLLFALENAPIKDKNTIDLESRAVTKEDLAKKAKIAEKEKKEAREAAAQAKLKEEAAAMAQQQAEIAAKKAKIEQAEADAAQKEQEKAKAKSDAEAEFTTGPQEISDIN